LVGKHTSLFLGAENREGIPFAVTGYLRYKRNPVGVERAHNIVAQFRNYTNIVYLTRLDAGDKVKVRNYMTEAERELGRLKHLVMKLAPPNSPQQIN
jgi:hypothetical protein